MPTARGMKGSSKVFYATLMFPYNFSPFKVASPEPSIIRLVLNEGKHIYIYNYILAHSLDPFTSNTRSLHKPHISPFVQTAKFDIILPIQIHFHSSVKIRVISSMFQKNTTSIPYNVTLPSGLI